VSKKFRQILRQPDEIERRLESAGAIVSVGAGQQQEKL
jgi:hypothetical protein